MQLALGLAIVAIMFIAGLLAVAFLWLDTRNPIGLVRMPRETVEAVIDVLDLQDDSVLIDLGAGDGRVLKAAKDRHPSIEAIGYENNWLIRSPRGIKWHRSDLLKADVSRATHVVVYLNPALNANLAVKLHEQLNPGVRIATVQFELPAWASVKTVELPNAPRHAAKIFVYQR